MALTCHFFALPSASDYTKTVSRSEGRDAEFFTIVINGLALHLDGIYFLNACRLFCLGGLPFVFVLLAIFSLC